MDKKIILGVLALVVASISLLLLVPDNSVNTPDTLPWKITHPTPETSRVFGITLGQSTLDDTEKAFKEQTEVSLFKTSEGKMLVEAFFDELNFNGLKAKFVLTIAVPQDELQGMFNRGLRMNSTPSGKRITLTPDDLARVRQSPVSSFTYLPTARLEESVLAKRFGTPDQRIRETKSGAVHWLYPQQGLDITLGGSEKPLLQYISPKDFELLRAPLLAQGEVLK
ncbi:MAG TPA: hypothetical protein VFW53_02505 [Gallionella sp.]|nr:hypothetical protein [Gallionella sp.]